MIAIPILLSVLSLLALVYAYKRERYWFNEAQKVRDIFAYENYRACIKHYRWWNDRNKYFWLALQLSICWLSLQIQYS